MSNFTTQLICQKINYHIKYQKFRLIKFITEHKDTVSDQ